MEVQKKLITPSRASELLQSNVRNRNVKNPVVRRYANDMANGRWKQDTFELIKISRSGVILDGQHRLLAVVKSNTPVYFHVVENMEDSVFDVLDTGSTRNSSDVFKINGVKKPELVPAIISYYNIIKNGGASSNVQVNVRKTNAELLSIYEENPLYWQDIATKSMSWYSAFGKILKPSFIGAYYALFKTISSEDALNFMDELCTGKAVTNESINILRVRLMNDKVSLHKLPTQVKSAFIIKTWNAYRKNTNIKVLKYTPSTDVFPTVI